jgi:hypothetical protein
VATISEIVERLPDTFVAKKEVRGMLEAAGVEVDPHGRAIGEFNRLLATRRQRESDARLAALRGDRERDAADEANRRQFERAGRDAEIALLKTVAPHWPTYHKMMRLCRDLDCLFSAERARDVGDVMAYKAALDEVPAMLTAMGVEPDSFAGGIWEAVCNTRRISEAQMKAMAVAAAKHATLAKKNMLHANPLLPPAARRLASGTVARLRLVTRLGGGRGF